MSDTKEVELGKIADLINGDRGKNYPSEGDFVNSGIPFINAGHLADGRVEFSKMNYISDRCFELLGSGKIRKNDILYCLRGSLGKTAIYRENGPAAIASSLVIIRLRNECNVDYLYHFLASPLGQREIRKYDNGSSQPNLSATSLKNYLLPLPPLDKQRRMAVILDKADALRQKRRLATRKLDSLNRSIFLNIFGEPDKLNEHPAQPLDQFVRKGDRINYGVVQPGDDCENGVPLVRVGDFTNGVFDFRNQKRIDPSIEANYKRSRLRGDEILVSCVGSIGTAAICTPDMKGMNIARAVARIPVDPDKINPTFLLAYLRMDFVQHYFQAELRTVNQPTLNIEQIAQTRIFVPDRLRQDKFAETIQRLNALASTAEISGKRLDGLFAAVQHRAFRGELTARVFAA